MLEAIQDAFQDTIPLTYFQALCDDPEEAEALHNLHKDRVRFAQNRPVGHEVG